EDGGLAVTARSRPTDPRLAIDLDAVIRFGQAIRIELARHRLAARGTIWRGRGGVIEIRPDRVVAKDVRTRMAGGRVALAGTVHTAGPRAGDLEGRADLAGVDLAAVGRSLEAWSLGRPGLALAGQVDLHARLERRRGQLSGTVEAELDDVVVRS